MMEEVQQRLPKHCVSKEDTERFIENYKRIYGKNGPITHSVWLDREHIATLADVLLRNPRLDGVRMHFGAYDTQIEGLDLDHDNQISLFAVPTELKDGERSDNWEAFSTLQPCSLNHNGTCPPRCK